MKQKKTIRVLLVLWTAALELATQEKQPPLPAAAQFEISPAADKIKIDGNLDEGAWKNCSVEFTGMCL